MIEATGDAAVRASVVVLTCGAAETTIACLDSIVASRYQNLQIVVVCNGGDEGVISVLKSFADRAFDQGREVRLLLNETNLGACTGRNQALEVVDGRWVAFLDNDIICRDQMWLNRAVDLLDSGDGRIGMVGPRLVRMTDPPSLECAGYAIDSRFNFVALGAGSSVDNPRFGMVREVQAVGNFVARTDTIRAISGFDTAFDPFGFENVDCCYRVKARGLSVVCDGRSDLYHLGHATTGGFDEGGRSILFSKSLLLRKRWRSVVESECVLYEALMSSNDS